MGSVGRRGWLGLPLLLQGCFFFDVLGTPRRAPDPVDTSGPIAQTAQDTGPPGPDCYQREALESGRLDVIDAPARIDRFTLAVRPALPAPSVALPGSLVDEPYYGAIDPEGPPFWQGWSYVDPRVDRGLPGDPFHPLEDEIVRGELAPAPSSRCEELGFDDGGQVAVFGASFPVCVIRDAITSDTTLTPDHVWLLDGEIRVGDGDLPLDVNPEPARVALTIQAGTQVFGRAFTLSGLVVTRGSEARVRGTAALPVIMGAVNVQPGVADVILDDPTDLTGRGQWLGLALSGHGLVNLEQPAVAAATGPRFYGGTSDADRSGDLDYVVIAEAGYADSVLDRAALNLEGAGRGTTVDYVQVLGSDDDCVQMLGGAAFVRHLVCLSPDQVGIDQDQGYTGEVQWALVVLGQGHGNRTFEGDSHPVDVGTPPATAPRMANLTFLGDGGSVRTPSLGALHRSGWRGELHRSVFADSGDWQRFEDGCLDIDDGIFGGLRYSEVVFDCARPLAACDD